MGSDSNDRNEERTGGPGPNGRDVDERTDGLDHEPSTAEEIKQAINDGTYKVDSNRLASRMMEHPEKPLSPESS